jgi:hypothetical protein
MVFTHKKNVLPHNEKYFYYQLTPKIHIQLFLNHSKFIKA